MIGKIFSSSFWQLAGPVSLWGKMPCRGDFIRRNLPFEQEKALEGWVREKRNILSPPEEISQRKIKDTFWHSLDYQAKRPQSADSTDLGHPHQPWCFILPPQSLPFASDRYLIGVWMDSSDKVGREYPLVMIQMVARRWVRQYFALHAEHPCEWLFNAARLISNSIHAQEGEVDRPVDEENFDHLALLMAKLNALWSLYAPDWRNFLGKRISLPDKETRQIQELVDPPHPDDSVRYLDGTRFLPWADWPDCVLKPSTQGFFWQQDLHGRFIGAILV